MLSVIVVAEVLSNVRSSPADVGNYVGTVPFSFLSYLSVAGNVNFVAFRRVVFLHLAAGSEAHRPKVRSISFERRRHYRVFLQARDSFLMMPGE